MGKNKETIALNILLGVVAVRPLDVLGKKNNQRHQSITFMAVIALIICINTIF